jgi:hypothetical protein
LARSTSSSTNPLQRGWAAAGGERSQSVERSGGLLQPLQATLRDRRTDPGQQLQGAKARDPVARIVGPAQHRQQVLDVGGLQELESAMLDVGDVAAGQFDLEQVAVMRASEQHRLLLECDPGLALRKDLVDDPLGLGPFVEYGDQPRKRALAAGRAERLGVLPLGLRDQRVGGVKDRLHRAIVAATA